MQDHELPSSNAQLPSITLSDPHSWSWSHACHFCPDSFSESIQVSDEPIAAMMPSAQRISNSAEARDSLPFGQS